MGCTIQVIWLSSKSLTLDTSVRSTSFLSVFLLSSLSSSINTPNFHPHPQMGRISARHQAESWLCKLIYTKV